MIKHINIALFVPHAGCPHLCSFCNQKTISGHSKILTPEDVSQAVETALKSRNCASAQLAFFGGSFTAVERDYRISLLEAAQPYLKSGKIQSIRISTRPDAVTPDILEELKYYGVSSIELGAQSMDDRVLLLNERGHDSNDVRKASRLIKEHGFELGLQMMTGLYGDTDEGAVSTAREIIKLSPDTVRIYPTVVLEGTRLAALYESGEFKPQTLDEAAELGAKLLDMFRESNIPVIRFGLHAGEDIEKGYVAGAYHPALREICESRIYLHKAKALLNEQSKGDYKIFVSPREISKMTGQKKYNINSLASLGYNCKVSADENLKPFEIYIRHVLPGYSRT